MMGPRRPVAPVGITLVLAGLAILSGLREP